RPGCGRWWCGSCSRRPARGCGSSRRSIATTGRTSPSAARSTSTSTASCSTRPRCPSATSRCSARRCRSTRQRTRCRRRSDARGKPCEAVSDPHGLLKGLLAEAADLGPVCLQFIDPYGDATFNRLQMAPLIAELEAAVRSTRDPAAAEHGQSVLRLAQTCRDGVHLYLKF